MKLSRRVKLLLGIAIIIVFLVFLGNDLSQLEFRSVIQSEKEITASTGRGANTTSVRPQSSFAEELKTVKPNMCGDECEWNNEQQRRRNTITRACANYTYQNITKGVLKHILVSDEYKVLYCYVPKVACTNWKRILLLLNGKNVTHVHSTFIPSLNTFEPGEVDKRLREYTKFMIVRNPHERLLSAYNQKFAIEENTVWHHNYGPVIRKNNIKFLRDKYNLNYTVSQDQQTRLIKEAKSKVLFQEFLRYVGNTDRNLNGAPEEHWREVYRLCNPCSIEYDMIGKLETIADDTKYTLSHIGADNLIHIMTKRPHPTNSSSERKVRDAFAKVTEEDLLLFEKRFGKDMALFGYHRPTAITRFKSDVDDMKDALKLYLG